MVLLSIIIYDLGIMLSIVDIIARLFRTDSLELRHPAHRVVQRF